MSNYGSILQAYALQKFLEVQGRVDLYNIEGRIVFGEMTFFSNGGFVNVYSEEMDRKIGSWIDLEKYHDDIRIS